MVQNYTQILIYFDNCHGNGNFAAHCPNLQLINVRSDWFKQIIFSFISGFVFVPLKWNIVLGVRNIFLDRSVGMEYFSGSFWG